MTPHWRLSAGWLVAGILIIVIGFSAICGSILLNMRRAAWELARQSSENLASTMDADITRNIEVYDLSLRAVVANMKVAEVHQVAPPLRHLILFDHALTASHFGALRVYDSAGHLMLDSSTLETPRDRAINRDYFVAHRADAKIGLLIGRPAANEAGEFSIHLSRRIDNPDGSFGGVVVGSIRLSYFHDLFRRVKIGPEDSIALVHRSGIVVMRAPFDIAMIGQDISKNARDFARIQTNDSGWLEAPGAIDRVRRQFVWRDGGGPLVIIVGRSLDRIYEPWRTDALRIVLAMAVLAALAIAAAVLLAREARLRNVVEHKLTVMATTDGLTGLSNRREFDDVLESEWRRARRSSTPLALMMIDADHFKAFNDMFGHQAGDKVLIGIAAAIRSEARRSGDCVARYGGEEFAVILPGLDVHAALVVAERIKASVEKMSWDGAHTTVSIGLAAVVPSGSWQPPDLIAAADAALYEAKERGRNCCWMAPPMRLLELAA